MVFGLDNRALAIDYSSPLRFAAVQIMAYFSGGNILQGSGVMIGYNDVLTAAHMLYNESFGGYAEYIEVTPARDGQIKPYGVATSSFAVVSEAWINGENYYGDYGVISLSKPVGYYTGFADVRAYNFGALGEMFFAYGYPGDLDGGKKAYYTNGSVDYLSQDFLMFTDDFDAYAGQSGSGVFAMGSSDVVGIVSHEERNSGEDVNSILGFTNAAANEINNWAEQNNDTLLFVDGDASMKPVIYGLNLMFYSFLGYAGDKESLDYLANLYYRGASVETISSIFYNSAQYSNTAASNYDNWNFVKHIYENTLQISYSEDDLLYWSQLLDSGFMSRTDILQYVAFLPIFADKHALDIYDAWHELYDGWSLEASGNQEDDILVASFFGDSALYGFGGDDTLIGLEGDDYLWGGKGSDLLIGDSGRDFFAWGENDDYDRVEDFSMEQDYIRLRGDFEWSFAAFDGNLLIESKNGYGGLILMGISPTLYARVDIIEGELI